MPTLPLIFRRRPVRSVALGVLACLAIPSITSALPAPPTAAEQAAWRDHGRTLPKPELLQPTLDPALPDYRSVSGLKGHLKGAASDVLAALGKDWIAAFTKLYPDVAIDLPPPYAGSLGALELIKGDLDFVMVSRELKPTDVSGFKARFGYAPLSTPISGGTYRHFGFLDSVTFFVNAANPIDHLTFAQLDALLSTTRRHGGEPIRTWGQLGVQGEWADQPIHVWAVKPWNGFEEFVRQRVLSVGSERGEWRTDLNFVETVFPISPHVAADRYAIGYAGMAYVGDGVKPLALAADAADRPVAPSYENIAAATYPLSRLCFINVNRRPGAPLDPVLREFIRFIVSREGQQVVLHQAVFLPLRDTQAAATRSAVE